MVTLDKILSHTHHTGGEAESDDIYMLLCNGDLLKVINPLPNHMSLLNSFFSIMALSSLMRVLITVTLWKKKFWTTTKRTLMTLRSASMALPSTRRRLSFTDLTGSTSPMCDLDTMREKEKKMDDSLSLLYFVWFMIYITIHYVWGLNMWRHGVYSKRKAIV